jgi:acylphosphatase
LGRGRFNLEICNPHLNDEDHGMCKRQGPGFGYRYFVTDCARETGVSGFVKNMSDGSVTIVAEGSDDALDKFVRMVKAQSDMVIRVDTLEVTRREPTGEFSGFGIRW